MTENNEKKSGSAGGTKKRIAFYIPTLQGGGAERAMLKLATEFSKRDWQVDLIVNKKKGSYVNQVPAELNVIELTPGNKLLSRFKALRAVPSHVTTLMRPVFMPLHSIMTIQFLSSLTVCLGERKPDIVISALFYSNLLAIWARRLSGIDTTLIVTEHNNLSMAINDGLRNRPGRWRWQFLAPLIRSCYGHADAVVAVSGGVADDLARTTGMERHRIETIYNPIVAPGLIEYATECRDSSSARDGDSTCPIVLGVGRLEPQKDFETLIRAFARVRSEREARLLILGEGEQRPALEALARNLEIQDRFQMPGWADNPYSYMRTASVFALSSAWEGLSTVLIEAMACGCPVVSTDCPSGSREILDDGRYGPLTSVGDDTALARTIIQMLDTPTPPNLLAERAADFSITASADRYLACIASANS